MHKEKKISLNATQLQWIAIICMIIDHVAWRFVPTDSTLGIVMHFFGRITFPIMAYFIAQGYHYSHNVPKYIRRLFILAFISIVPFHLMAFPIMGFLQNTIFTFAFGLLALYLADKVNNKFLRGCIVFVFSIISILFDGGVSGIVMIYFMSRTKNKTLAIFGGIGIQHIIDYFLQFGILFLSNNLNALTFGIQDVAFIGGTLVSGLLILCYNGEKGRKSKYLFYVIYPLHLLLIWGATLFFVS